MSKEMIMKNCSLVKEETDKMIEVLHNFGALVFCMKKTINNVDKAKTVKEKDIKWLSKSIDLLEETVPQLIVGLTKNECRVNNVKDSVEELTKGEIRGR